MKPLTIIEEREKLKSKGEREKPLAWFLMQVATFNAEITSTLMIVWSSLYNHMWEISQGRKYRKRLIGHTYCWLWHIFQGIKKYISIHPHVWQIHIDHTRTCEGTTGKYCIAGTFFEVFCCWCGFGKFACWV